MGEQPSFDCTWELFDAGDGGAVPLLLPARATAVLSPGQHVAPTQPEGRSQKQDQKGLFLIFLFFFSLPNRREKKKAESKKRKTTVTKKKVNRQLPRSSFNANFVAVIAAGVRSPVH